MEEKDYYYVYTLRLANYLCQQGHYMRGIMDSGKDPDKHYKVILFDNTEKLKEDLRRFNNKIK